MNNMISNNEFGIVLRNSVNNTVFHNSFLNNTWRSVSNINSINSWDNGIEGNYWSDYKGADDDHDAIGDAPYIMDGNNQDNHPIMGAFSDFTVIYEKETHHVFTICNSTVSQFQFNETIRMLKFNVTGINNTSGFCRITIPEKLIPWPYIVLVDNEQVNATSLPLSNATHTFLYFTYNHNTQEVKILSKSYYELLEKYNTLLENYQNLNSTYSQLLANHNILNSTYQEMVSNYNKLLEKHDMLNQTYQELMANYTELENNYNSSLTDYNILLSHYNSLISAHKTMEQEYANTRTALWCVSVVTMAITILASSLTMKYRKKSKEQKEIAEKYKSELERVSLIDTARAQFKADAQRRKEKIRKFQNKYGITVRPRDTLEDIITSLELKKEKSQQ
jgi:parallel beta-helix repeat protein